MALGFNSEILNEDDIEPTGYEIGQDGMYIIPEEHYFDREAYEYDLRMSDYYSRNNIEEDYDDEDVAF